MSIRPLLEAAHLTQGTLFNEQQLDEISDRTLSRYITRAAQEKSDIDKKLRERHAAGTKTDRQPEAKLWRQRDKRSEGVRTAIKRIVGD